MGTKVKTKETMETFVATKVSIVSQLTDCE
jgi:hypothetical protein